MAEFYDYCREGKGYDAGNRLRSEAYGSINSYPAAGANSSVAPEFNPRANSGTGGGARSAGVYWPPLPAEPTPAVVPRWWVSPAAAVASPTTSYGRASYPRQLIQENPSAEPASNATANAVRRVEDAAPTGIPAFPVDLHADSVSSNPYLTADKSASTNWRQQQQQLDDWSEAGLSSIHAYLPQSAASRAQAATEHSERGVGLHPLFPDQQSHASANIHNLPQFSVLNRPRASPLRSTYTSMHGDGTRSRALQDELHCWGTDQGRLSVGKSQSMRALYEENAALRRALHSIRSGSAYNFDSTLPLQSEQGLRELDRCIVSDVAEGRALSMRERGRWAMQDTGDGSYPMWVGTPRRQWAALHNVQAGGGAHHRRPRYQYQNQWWDEGNITAEHPLFYGGGSFGGWPESEAMCWGDMQNECPSRAADADDGSRTGDHQAGTSLKQLLGGGSEKWRREGKKKVGRRRREVEAKRQGEGQYCPMCGGRLRHVEGGKSRVAGGLPLRLCPACHPHAAASLPHSTTSPPALPSHRHHVATAVFMACRPTPAHHEDVDQPPPKPLKFRSSSGSRSILDLCRHFVGLSTKSPPPSN